MPLHWVTVVVLFVLDQGSKYWVVANIQIGARIEVMPMVNLIHTKNKGAAFGMFHQSGELFRALFFGAVTLICLYMLILWLGTTPLGFRLQRFCMSLILGGAFGNLYDRVTQGEVTDFIDTYFRSYHFYTFNIADSGISVGVTLLIVSMIPWATVKEKLRFKKA